MNIANTPAYELIRTEEIPELDSIGYILSHKKTKARVVLLENSDDNKVFNIGFRTPPTNSTGVPHIVEHTVLSGSHKFPAKDPFAELAQGSLNTFLNAMTYPDKTVYPVASVNNKDFQNLMDVYLDAVFHPNLYEEKKIFLQEGWHYELDDVDGELIYNGVVFNEMKGEFSSADERLDNLIRSSLFPESEYGVVSGGDPKNIPDLTWEEYKDFHSRYYHPSNSYIYLYGDMDFEEKLNWIDEEYLSEYDYLYVESMPKVQKPFDAMREAFDYYSVPTGEGTQDKTYYAYGAVCGDTLDPYMYQAFQVLEYALVEAIGAPIKEALVKAGIGTEIDGGYDESYAQPFFAISAKNCSEDSRDEFLRIVKQTLQEIVDEGVNKTSLRAAINAMEFQFREADFGRFPKGLMYGLTAFDSWLYDDDKPFIHLRGDDTFGFLRNQVDTDYYDKLIDRYLLNNPHSVFVTLVPKEGLAVEEDKAEKDRLKKIYDGLTTQEKQDIVDQTKELKKYQEEPSTPEQLATIPVLELSDISTKARPLVNELRNIGGIDTLFHDVFTNGISYIRLSFDITDLEKYAPYIGLIADVLGAMDTDKYDKLELSNELLLHSGGYGVGTDSFVNRHTKEYKIRLEITSKVLFAETDYICRLLAQIITQTHLDDADRLREIIAERRSAKLDMMQAAGHSFAVNRASAYFKEASKWMEQLKGYEYYEFISDLDDNFDARKDELISVIQMLRKCIFTKERLMMDITTTSEGYEIFESGVGSLTDSLYETTEPDIEPAYQVPEITGNEAFITTGGVQYVARAGMFDDKGIAYSGTFRVLRTLLSYDYLWNEVRAKGGAYGVMCNFINTGSAYVVSYRDPNLRETNEVYKTIAGYLRNLDLTDRDLTKFIIGSIRDLDAPLSPKSAGARSYSAYMSDSSYEELQRTRDELLGTTVQELRDSADMVEAFLSDGHICVVGSEEKIRSSQDMFDMVKVLK